MIKLITQRAHDFLAMREAPVTIDTALGTPGRYTVSVSKTADVASVTSSPKHLISDDSLHIGPSDFDSPLVIGVDPSGKATGVAVYLRGKYVWSTTVHPRKGLTGVIQAMRDSPIKPMRAAMFIEWNIFGKGGQAIAVMAHAAGVIETVYTMMGVNVTVHETKLNEWRSALGLPCKGDNLKLASMQRCGQMRIKVCSHDEAEAVLIAEYGSSKLRYLKKIETAKK